MPFNTISMPVWHTYSIGLPVQYKGFLLAHNLPILEGKPAKDSPMPHATLPRWQRITNSGRLWVPGATTPGTGGDHLPLMPSHSLWRWPGHSAHLPWRQPLGSGYLPASRQIQWQALLRGHQSRLHGHPSRYGRHCHCAPFNICSLLHIALFAHRYLLA